MDVRRNPAARTARFPPVRLAVLALVALGASYGGAALTSEALARLADAGTLPAVPVLRPDGMPGPLWLALTVAGGMLAGLAAVMLVALATRRRMRAAAAALAPVPLERDIAPAESLAWLHLVGGSSARRVAHAAAEVVAPWIAAGERVLLIDGGPRLRLHGPLVAEPALGLAECLQRDVPLLGVVQCVGVPGLYLLVHGGPAPGRAWSGLGRLVDDARQHFDRIVIALDLGTPYDVGRALAGRYVEAWWPDADPERRAGAQSLSERLGIRLRGMGLDHEAKPMLEHLRERIDALRQADAPRPEELAVGGARPAPAPAPALRLEPIVLDCDLQVRERLRFLMWMRRLQREERRRPVVPEAVHTG